MIAFIVFTAYFYLFNSLYRNLLKDPYIKTFENANYIYTGIHAILSSIFSIMFVINGINKDTYLNLITISPAFAIFDISLLIDPRNNVNTKSLLIFHHLLIIIGYLMITDYLRLNDAHLSYFAYNFMSEISTPFLNMSIFLNKKKFTDNIIFKLNSALVMFTYFTFRIFTPSQITYHIYLNDSMFILSLQMILNFMNYHWFYKLCKKCLEFFS